MMTRLTQIEFIRRCKLVHGDKYDYSLVEYKNSHIKIKIICLEHGIFDQLPYQHTNGHGCIKCVGLNNKTTVEFINLSRKIHNDKYDYSLVEYKNTKTNIKIICPKHGIFEQNPQTHLLLKMGCSKCSGMYRKSNEEFIEKSNIIHNNKYNYSKVNYISAHKKIIILCNKHGEFKQTPNSHLKGIGCPNCHLSKGELKILQILKENNIKFEEQKTFTGCKNKQKLRFDFYLPEINTCVEYDGEQHFKKYWFDKDNTNLFIRQKRDLIKTTFCKENNINLIRIKYDENIKEKLQWLINLKIKKG